MLLISLASLCIVCESPLVHLMEMLLFVLINFVPYPTNLLIIQATYDEVKAALREASENPTLGKFIGYTEDQVLLS